MIPPKTKICKKCMTEKPITDFGVDMAYKDGFRTHCKKCVGERRQIRNAEKVSKLISPREGCRDYDSCRSKSTKLCSPCALSKLYGENDHMKDRLRANGIKTQKMISENPEIKKAVLSGIRRVFSDKDFKEKHAQRNREKLAKINSDELIIEERKKRNIERNTTPEAIAASRERLQSEWFEEKRRYGFYKHIEVMHDEKSFDAYMERLIAEEEASTT